MRRQTLFHLFLSCLVLLVATGCGDDDPTGPSSDLELEDVFTAEEAVITEDGAVENLRMIGVTFVFGKATLTEDAKPILDKFAEVFPQYRSHTFAVEGHTDSRGSAAYNMRLSADRAEAVREYLVNQVSGPADEISAAGFGEERPIGNNATAQGRAQNRRIEIIIRPK